MEEAFDHVPEVIGVVFGNPRVLALDYPFVEALHVIRLERRL